MHHFKYSNDKLHCESVELNTIAQEYGTPTYVYSANTITDNYTRLDSALLEIDHEIKYAVKANSNLSILRLLASHGSGFDIVSAGELFRVIKAGGNPDKCTFAGVGKTDEEITYALEQGIYCFNAESEAEVVRINEIAGHLSKTASIAYRVNPNVDAKTHKYISTGKSENKFGVDFEDIEAAYERASRLPNIKLRGLQMHIGSQLTSAQPFEEAVTKVAPLALSLKNKYGIEFFSIGGGVGIVYEDALISGSEPWWNDTDEGRSQLTVEAYAAAVVPTLKNLDLKIFVEPGRYIAGNAGVLLTKCIYEKTGKAKTFKIVDAGMNDLIRPALYEGYHQVVPLNLGVVENQQLVDVVGPVCETGDFFCQNEQLANFGQGDVIALMSAGAYGFVMASNYNTRNLPSEILVTGSKSSLIRRRQTFDDIVALEEDL